jgi:hypothetical protein
MNILLVGGSRWAHVVTSVILKYYTNSSVYILTEYNYVKYKKVYNQEKRVNIIDRLSDAKLKNIFFIYILNKAANHAKYIDMLIRYKKPILVEKPFTLLRKDAEYLIQKSSNSKTIVAPAYVYLFARPILELKKITKSLAQINCITVEWEDTAGEIRDNHAKNYDHAISVIADVFPHAYSIIHFLVDIKNTILHKLVIFKGGQKVIVKLNSGSIIIYIKIGRNGPKRVRNLTVNNNIFLDFDNCQSFKIVNGDESKIFKNNESPINNMLSEFYSNANNSKFETEQLYHYFNTYDQIEDRYIEWSKNLMKRLKNRNLDGYRNNNLKYFKLERTVNELKL